MFLLHIVHTSAARTEPSACRNRLQRIMRPQQTGTHAVGVSSVMSHAHPGKVRECARLYTARPISLFPTCDGPGGIGTCVARSGLDLDDYLPGRSKGSPIIKNLKAARG